MRKGILKQMMCLAGAVVFLTACTGQGGTVTVPSITLPTAGATETGSSQTSASGTSDLGESAEAVVKVTAVNRVFVGDFYGTEKTLLKQVIHQVHLVSGNEQVAKLLEQHNEDIFTGMEKNLSSDLEDQANAFYSGVSPDVVSEYNYITEFRRVDGDVLSMYGINRGYFGGMDPYTGIFSQNFDMQTGEPIAFSDVVKDVKAFAKAAVETIKNSREYAKEYKAGAYSDTLEKDTYAYLQNDALAWTITNKGIELWYGEYQSGANRSGQINILIPYEEHKDLIDGKYFENAIEYDVTSRVKVEKSEPETLNAFDYCFQEFGFILYDLNLVSGVYRGTDGSTIAIYPYGTFVYEKGSDYLAGDIRAIEGGFLLITGFYNETKNMYEYENSGELSYAGDGFEGGLYQNGSQTYSLEEKFEREGDAYSNPWTGKEITVEGCDIVLYDGTINEHPFDEADMSIDEYTRSFWLYSSTDVENLQLFNVEMVASQKYGLEPRVGELWFSKQHFTTDDLWRVTISMPGDLPCNGFSYENAEGKTKYYAIGESGADGSLYVEEFTPQR